MPAPSGRAILRQESLGFSLLIVLIWATEVIGVPHLFFGGPAEFLWSRVLLRTGVIAAIWIWVHLRTRRMVKRLHELEEFLRICSWCRKVDHGGEWLTIEQYFDSKFKTGTSHGICPECANRQRDKHRAELVNKPGTKPGAGKN